LTVGSRAEPGCVNYIAHFVESEAATVLIYEQYVDEAAVEHHRGTPHFHQYAVGGLYKKMRDRKLEKLEAIG
jgi:quinol monooxygenase YgiN